jgi:hypothetical protein
MSPEMLAEIVANYSGFSPSGCCARFIKINDEIGLKIYENEGTRDKALEDQRKMAALGYAPETGIAFQVGCEYGLVTQVAIPLVQAKLDDEEWYEFNERYRNDVSKLQHLSDEKDELVRNMKANGYDISWDDHWCNFGILNGKVVCIDFS